VDLIIEPGHLIPALRLTSLILTAMDLKQITPMVLTYNEAPNLGRMLAKLDWAQEVLIVDSFSDDETIAIARARPRTRILQRRFDTFASQCNYGLEHTRTEWVLSIDADYVLSDELIKEIAALNPDATTTGYRANFKYYIYGQSLRSSLYPPRTVLYKLNRARYREDGYGHRVVLEGEIKQLTGVIHHDDRKPLERWFAEQVKYAGREAEHLASTPIEGLNRTDKIRRWVFVAPILVSFYTLILRGAVLDGWRGWFYVFQRTLAELMLSLKLLEKRFNK
jgi:glycosyltransferase involved in cell wall biosynthesis